MLPQRMTKNGWSPWFFLGALAMTVFGMGMTWPAWRDMYDVAIRQGEARYVLLVPVIAVWLAWVRRRRMLQCQPQGFWIGLALIVLGGGGYAVATNVQSAGGFDVNWFDGGWTLMWHLGAVLMTFGCGLTLLGTGVFVKFLPVFGVLLFLVPLPRTVCHPIEMPVQLLTSEMTVGLYAWLGMEVELIGPSLMIQGTRLPVSEVCQGMPMVMDLFLVSWAFVFSTPLRPSVRLVILLLSPVSAVLCGALGLVSTVWVYGYDLSLQQADLLHEVGGWFMLLVAFLLLTAVIRALAWASVPVRQYTLAYDY